MNLLEHESKKLLVAFKIPVPIGTIITEKNSSRVALPAVIKSQVPAGGRSKAGGIILVNSREELKQATNKLFDLEIKGHLPTYLLAEERLSIQREFYLSLLIDHKTANLKIVAHVNGGIEVEKNEDFVSWIFDYSKPNTNILGQALANYYELQGQTFLLQDLVENLIKCFKLNDATLIEVNPVILTDDGRLIAGDCKMTLDDAAAFRHPEWSFETPVENNNFVELDPTGNVATIANGAGLAMATVDAVKSAGYKPINFLDVGGGASEELILSSFTRLHSYPNIKAIIINIFAGITRCDDVARAIIAAKSQFPTLPSLYIRLTGTNFNEAKEILKDANIELQDTLDSCIAKLTMELPHE